MSSNHHRNIATFTHLSALSQYLIPMGNFIVPIVLWQTNRERSELVDRQGKECVNFQISTFLYVLICLVVAVPAFVTAALTHDRLAEHQFHVHFSDLELSAETFTTPLIVGLVAIGILAMIKVAEFLLTIYAAVKTANGEEFRYPATIRFIK